MRLLGIFRGDLHYKVHHGFCHRSCNLISMKLPLMHFLQVLHHFIVFLIGLNFKIVTPIKGMEKLIPKEALNKHRFQTSLRNSRLMQVPRAAVLALFLLQLAWLVPIDQLRA